MHATLPLIRDSDFPAIKRRRLETLQVNLGYKCNQTCVHCHVNAGPTRTEMMPREIINDVLAFVQASHIGRLDITGGAPELNPHFCDLVRAARSLDVHVMDRCNLTILEQPGHEDLAQFLADHQVKVIASLPCYLEENVDRQRGKGVFNVSIRALQTLNRLYVLTNMPIQRFGSMLISKGEFGHYMDLLKNAYQPENLESVMCRSLVSVDWRGYVYDCDFNQMLGLPLAWKGKPRTHLRELVSAELRGNQIVVKNHCYGCTAGQGSSCGGALAA